MRKRHVKKNLLETEQKQEKTIIELFFYVFSIGPKGIISFNTIIRIVSL